MLLIKPIALTPAMIIASNAGEPDPSYNPATTYELGDRVYVDSSGKSYECAQAPAVGHPPSTSPLYWKEAQPSNRWAMFDTEISTATQTTGDSTTTVGPGRRVNAITLHGLVGNSVTITQRNQAGTQLYQKTKTLRASPAGWYEYFFAERNQVSDLVFDDLLLVAGGQIDIEIMGTACACNGVTIGTRHDIGQLQFGAQTSIIDYSRKTTTAEGVQSFKQGRYSKRISGQLMQEKGQYNATTALLESVRATPCVWVGAPTDADYAPLTVLGFYRDFSITVSYPTHHLCSIEIESVT
jgi:hypothetical protein